MKLKLWILSLVISQAGRRVSLLPLTGSNIVFPGLQMLRQLFTVSVSLIVAMQFLKDPATNSYERKVFGFLEVTGSIGGLFEILEIGGGMIVGFFSGNIFLYSLLTKLYHIEEPEAPTYGSSSKVRMMFYRNHYPKFKSSRYFSSKSLCYL